MGVSVLLAPADISARSPRLKRRLCAAVPRDKSQGLLDRDDVGYAGGQVWVGPGARAPRLKATVGTSGRKPRVGAMALGVIEEPGPAGADPGSNFG